MAVTIKKYSYAIVQHDDLIYRGPIQRVNPTYVTIHPTSVHGAVSGLDYSDHFRHCGPYTFVRDIDTCELYR